MVNTLRTTIVGFDDDLNNKTFSIKRAAKLTGFSERSLRDLCQNGDIPEARKIGRAWRIPALWLRAYLPTEFWSAICPHCGCQFNSLEPGITGERSKQSHPSISRSAAQAIGGNPSGFRTAVLVVAIFLTGLVSYGQATDWSNPKIPRPIAVALAKEGGLDLVNSTFDEISYHPWPSFAPIEPSANRVNYFKDGRIIGTAIVIDGQRLASVAIGNLTHQETARVLCDLAYQIGPTSDTGLFFMDLFKREPNKFLMALCLIALGAFAAVHYTVWALVYCCTKLVALFSDDTQNDSPPDDDNPSPQSDNNPVPPAAPTPMPELPQNQSPLDKGEEEVNDNKLQKLDKGSLEIEQDPLVKSMDRLRPDPKRIPEIPLNDHSHEFDGRFSEMFKRGRIRSHTETEKAQVELAVQRNAFLDQAVGIVQKNNQVRRDSVLSEINLRIEASEKLFHLQRMPRQAEVDDLRLDLDLLNIQAELAKARKQLAIDLDRLDALITAGDKPHDISQDDKEATRLQQEIDGIVRKISSIAGLEKACVEMKARYSQEYWPLIDRLFRKVIDSRKENL